MNDNDNFKNRNPQTLMPAGLSLLIIFFVFSVVVFLSLISGGALFGTAGIAINSFVLGSFGHSAYPLFVSALFVAFKLMRGKKITAGRRSITCYSIMFLCAVLGYHQLTSTLLFLQSPDISGYLLSCFNSAVSGASGATGGGVVFGLILYPISALFGIAGSYIILCLIFATTLSVLIYSGKYRFSGRTRYRVEGIKDYPAGFFSAEPGQVPPAQPQETGKNYVLPDFKEQPRVLGAEKPATALNLQPQENPNVEPVPKKLFVGFIDDYVNQRKRSAKQARSYDILYSSAKKDTPQPQDIAGYNADNAAGNRVGDASKLGGSSYVDTFGDDIESKKKYILTPIDNLLRPESDYGYGNPAGVFPINLSGRRGSQPERGEDAPQLINHGLNKTPPAGDTDIFSGGMENSGASDIFRSSRGTDRREDKKQQQDNALRYQRYANENSEGGQAKFSPEEVRHRPESEKNKFDSLIKKYSGLANEKSNIGRTAEQQSTAGQGGRQRGTPAVKGTDTGDDGSFLNSGNARFPDLQYYAGDAGGSGGAGVYGGSENTHNPVNSGFPEDPGGIGSLHGSAKIDGGRSADSLRKDAGDIMRFDSASRDFSRNKGGAGEFTDDRGLSGTDGMGGAQIGGSNARRDGDYYTRGEGRDIWHQQSGDRIERGNTGMSDRIPQDTDSAGVNARSVAGDKSVPEEIKVQTRLSMQNDKKPVVISPYVPPLTSLLKDIIFDPSEIAENYEEKVATLEQTLEEFKVPAKVVTVTPGPAVTRYELQMPPGVPVSKLTSRANDIAMCLASNGEIRIEAPIPGKSLLGIELPNKKRAKVGLKEVIDSQEFLASKSPVAFALGKDITGKNVIVDFVKMPHLLVAGSTGSGKSVCLNTLIVSLLYKSSPEDVRLILIDPKRVEFNVYNGLPHLMLKDVITDAEKAISAFNWAINEMERRFSLFKDTGAKDIISYNEKVKKTDLPKLARIMIIVDELAELMMINKRELEDKIKKISQLSRAAGIHLILATQRPSVDIITGVIKANLSSRATFKLMTQADSRTVLDASGAEKLLGEGDMIFITSSMPKPVRLQGPFVSMSEVEAIVEFIKENNDSLFDEDVAEKILNPISEQPDEIAETDPSEELDKYFTDALRLAVEAGQISISMVQRKFAVGYSRAGKIIDEMERQNFITPFEGSKPRQVLISREEFERRFGDND